MFGLFVLSLDMLLCCVLLLRPQIHSYKVHLSGMKRCQGCNGYVLLITLFEETGIWSSRNRK